MCLCCELGCWKLKLQVKIYMYFSISNVGVTSTVWIHFFVYLLRNEEKPFPITYCFAYTKLIHFWIYTLNQLLSTEYLWWSADESVDISTLENTFDVLVEILIIFCIWMITIHETNKGYLIFKICDLIFLYRQNTSRQTFRHSDRILDYMKFYIK